MRLPPVLALVAASIALQGCIIYDHDCVGCGDGPIDDRPRDDGDCDQGPDCGDDDGSTDSGSEEPELNFDVTLTPAEAELGQIFIASLHTVGDEAPGYDEIADVQFYGSVEILAEDVRSHELLLTLQIPADGEPGGADLIVEFVDGSAKWVEDALMIYEAGSGHEAGSSDDGSYDPCL